MHKQRMRNGFSMVTAVFIIVIMATVGIFVMNLSGKIVKSTTTQYQHEQAELYAKSYTEYAILAVTGNDRSSDCLQTISTTIDNYYRVRTHISYIVNGTEVNTNKCDGVRVLSNTVTRPDTPLTIIVDAYVDYKDPDTGKYHTVHRRTVQKI